MRYQIHWCRPGEDGQTLADKAERFKSVLVPDPPEFTFYVDHVWEWFWHLCGRRQQGLNGPQPLTYRELESWRNSVPFLVAHEEIAWLMAMDEAYLDQLALEREEEKRKKEDRAAIDKLKSQLKRR